MPGGQRLLDRYGSLFLKANYARLICVSSAMNREMLLHHLRQAHQHIEEGRLHMARQHALIAQLEARGEDAAHARRALAMLEQMQAQHVADGQKIEKALEEGEPAFSAQDDFRRMEGVRAIAYGSLDELRWYQAQLAVTAQVLERSKQSLDTSKEVLRRLERLAPNDPDPSSGAASA